MGLFNSNILAKASMKLVEPVGNLKADMSYLVNLYSDHLQVKDVLSRKDVSLSINQIQSVFYGNEAEIIEKDKSVIGRALIGGVVGPVGAVVGAVSGVGTKKKKINHTYLIISYMSSSGTEGIIKLEDNMQDGRGLYKKLNGMISQTDSKHVDL